MSNFNFNLRVYGILINSRQEVLVTDEIRFGLVFTKFPGGGLEFGEGTIDCIKRECMEELGEDVEVKEHFYTTDYFQPSAFNEAHQLISIYYLIKSKNLELQEFNKDKFAFPVQKEGVQIFRWIHLSKLSAADFMFPVDKIVVNKIIDSFKMKE